MAQGSTDAAVDQLIPALIQCFGVIILGYLAGRWRILSDFEVQGLNSYVTTFALPAVFFRVMVTIDFSGVCWALVAAVSLSKLVAFLLAFCVTLMLSRKSQLGVAAILSMFVSQSNDVALGYPVLYALYGDLASYVYLFAPAQLVVLNPISYAFLEWHDLKQNARQSSENPSHSKVASTTSSSSPSRWKCFLQVIWRVTLSPIFFMTVIGVVFNFILNHHIPFYVDGLLKIVADSFSATALFTLGFGMVGKMGRITERQIHMLVAILMLKLVILPFVTRELVVQMMPASKANETLRYSTFGFLYGAIPTAPPVYLFAAKYQVLPVVTGVALVLGTFLCAPMMFILARMVTMYLAEPSEYDYLLGSTVKGVSWMSVAGCLWTVIILFLSRKAFRVPHRFTLCYLACVLLSCLGVVAGHFLNQQNGTSDVAVWRDHLMTRPADWLHYIQFCLFFIGCTGARFWTTLIAFSLFIQRYRGVCYILRHQAWIYLTGFSIPVFVTSVLLLTSTRQRIKDVDPAFQYGRGQLIVSLVVLLLNTTFTLLFAIWYIRLGSSEQESQVSPQIDTNPTQTHEDQVTAEPSDSFVSVDSAVSVDTHPEEQDRCSLFSVPDHRSRESFLSSREHSCRCSNMERRRQCARLITRYERLCRSSWSQQLPLNESFTRLPSTNAPESHAVAVPVDGDEFQHQRHMVLLFVLLTTMFFGICLCTWRLVQEAPSGVYLVLEFLDGTFNFGQGVALFILFGLDTDLIIFPIKRIVSRYTRKFLGVILEATKLNVVTTILNETGSAEQKAHQFVTYHLKTCVDSIGKMTGCGTESVRVFSADALKRWLILSGLVHTQLDATNYLAALKSAHIIQEFGAEEVTELSADSGLVNSNQCLLFFTPSALEMQPAE
ncbi:hypothetical protein PHET_02217 [Paragonimus heterotremus]|uniref:Integral membrane protein GPR155 n=1 Tax=Paragonimus heterotremus TaxID=100268 RepID=A0A8J4WKK1_9TREM|nr:hypothetical protein PHET_02217 [Paragonimus heterotremus]